MVKNLPANAGDFRVIRKIPWRRAWQPTPVFLPEESHGQRSLAGNSPKGCKESDTTEATQHKAHTFLPLKKKVLRADITTRQLP